MRRDRPLAPGAKQTDNVRRHVHKLLAYFPDPLGHMDPLEQLERACADVLIEAQQVLSEGGNDPRANAAVRTKLLTLLAWADAIDRVASATSQVIRLAGHEGRRRDANAAHAQARAEMASLFGEENPNRQARKGTTCGDLLLWVSKLMRRG